MGLDVLRGQGHLHFSVEVLRSHLDTNNKALAAQDFHYACQSEAEIVVNYICRIEHLFQIVYGRAEMKTEAREALLYGQLHAGLKYELMKSSSVSGAQLYKQLCQCAKTEEKRLIGLKTCQSYQLAIHEVSWQRLPGGSISS